MTALTSNPTNPPDTPTANTVCSCNGWCGTHTGQCKAQHGHRHPATRTLMLLETTPDGGALCPYCRLVAIRPGATAPAALKRPAAECEQDDLFDIDPAQIRCVRTALR